MFAGIMLQPCWRPGSGYQSRPWPSRRASEFGSPPMSSGLHLDLDVQVVVDTRTLSRIEHDGRRLLLDDSRPFDARARSQVAPAPNRDLAGVGRIEIGLPDLERRL